MLQSPSIGHPTRSQRRPTLRSRLSTYANRGSTDTDLLGRTARHLVGYRKQQKRPPLRPQPITYVSGLCRELEADRTPLIALTLVVTELFKVARKQIYCTARYVNKRSLGNYN